MKVWIMTTLNTRLDGLHSSRVQFVLVDADKT
jgi:hypothetical protein